MTIAHGTKVILSNISYGTEVEGTLWSPDEIGTRFYRKPNAPAGEVYAVEVRYPKTHLAGDPYTIILPDGRKYRDVGTVRRA